MYNTAIRHLHTLRSDHCDKSTNHPSPYKATATLWTAFPVLHVTSPWLTDGITGSLYFLLSFTFSSRIPPGPIPCVYESVSEGTGASTDVGDTSHLSHIWSPGGSFLFKHCCPWPSTWTHSPLTPLFLFLNIPCHFILFLPGVKGCLSSKSSHRISSLLTLSSLHKSALSLASITTDRLIILKLTTTNRNSLLRSKHHLSAC